MPYSAFIMPCTGSTRNALDCRIGVLVIAGCVGVRSGGECDAADRGASYCLEAAAATVAWAMVLRNTDAQVGRLRAAADTANEQMGARLREENVEVATLKACGLLPFRFLRLVLVMLTIRLQAANKELSDANFELKATKAQLEQAQRDLAAAQVRMIFNGLRFSQRLQLPYNVYNTL